MRSLLRLAPLSLSVVVAVFGCSSEKGKAADPGMTPPSSIACAATPLTDIGTDFFTDISESSGIQKNNFVANPLVPIPINDHSRLAFADLDGDGFDDIVAHSLYPNALKGIPFEHLVFLSNHDKTFRDFSDESGLRAVQAGFFTFGDVDNDGDQDCFAGLDIALAGQTSSLLLNDGKGHFTKKEGSGLEKAALSANGVFADFNGDAILDLYSGNGGTSDSVADQLFFGVGDGTFTLTTKNLGLQALQPTNGVVTCDYDDDGDQDIFVAHYGVSVALGWKTLWQNDGTGTFTNVAQSAGFHALATGNYYLASTGNGTMVQPGDPSAYVGSNGFGIDCQDIDGDGHLDIWLATISH
ncbi:MAG: VCBS repeat-containing protein, partial [Polyangiaceae bacterium]